MVRHLTYLPITGVLSIVTEPAAEALARSRRNRGADIAWLGSSNDVTRCCVRIGERTLVAFASCPLSVKSNVGRTTHSPKPSSRVHGCASPRTHAETFGVSKKCVNPCTGELKSSSNVFADETKTPVLDPGRGRTKIRKLFH